MIDIEQAVTRNDFQFVEVFKKMTPELVDEVSTFWAANNAISSPEERKRRAGELICFARNSNGEMVGVATTGIEKVGWNNKVHNVYAYRTFIREADRKPLLFLALFFSACNVLERAAKNGEPSHVLFRTENRKFMRRGVVKRVFEPGGATFLARNRLDQDVWIYPLHTDGFHRKATLVKP